MKKIKLLLTGMVLFSLCSYSQTVSLGARGGLSIPNIVAGGDNPISKGYTSRIVGGGGIFAELGINNHVAFRLGVEYSIQGGRRNGIQAMPADQIMAGISDQITAGITAGTISPNIGAELGGLMSSPDMPEIFYVDVKNTADFDYLMIPLSIQVGTDAGKRWRVYANAGPFVSFLLHGEQITKGSSKMCIDAGMSQTLWNIISAKQPDIDAPELAKVLQEEMDLSAAEVITRDLNPVNAGIQGDIGLSYRHERHRIFLEIGGNYGFVKMQKDKSNGSNHIGAGSIMLGYAIRLR